MANSSGYSLFKSLIKPLRDTDASVGGDLLKRFLLGPQALHDVAEALIQTLPNQLNPITVRADLLGDLKSIVGFTSELRSITDRLSERQLRRLIQLAVPLWNQRSTETGLISAIRLLTGRNAVLTDWFGYRALLGETYIGDDNWLIGGDPSLLGEYWSDVRIMDDGSLDELLAIDLMKLMRPLSERIELALPDFLDHFDIDLNLWETLAGADPTLVDSEMVIAAATEVQPIVPIITAVGDHRNYLAFTSFRFVHAASVLIAKFYLTDAGDRYQLELSPTGPQVVLKTYTAGVPATLLSWTPTAVSLVKDANYKLQIQVQNVGANRQIRILIDGVVVVPNVGDDLVDNTGPEHGPYSFMASSHPVALDNVESWKLPLRFATIVVGNVVSLTSNFVQP